MKRLLPVKHFLYVFYISILYSFADGDLSCKDENGNNVDWLIVYKLPQIHKPKAPNPFIATGESYAYLSVDEVYKTSKWILSKQSIASNVSVIASTLNSLTDSKNVAYLIYNDERPGKASSSTKWGHTKGVLAFDDKSGYWLIHSVPKFPDVGQYQFPAASKEHGQMFICVTYNFSAIDQIGNQLRYMKPQIYMSQSNYMVSRLSLGVQSLFTEHPSFVKKAPWYSNVSLISKSGIPFVSFSKHPRFHDDLYSALVAPVLKSPLCTETWQRGSGTLLPSNCSIPYPVWNIKSINMSFYYMMKVADTGFISTSDHSKWAVSTEQSSQWTCIGDINRMASQEKRGGGTLCLKSEAVWKNFYSIISTIEICHNFTLKPTYFIN